ncbi:MAG: S9 family peptidase [Rhizomicrobium sp.]|jgi:dipeptidyl aminopeptidase/acylaminoacyl peptidase
MQIHSAIARAGFLVVLASATHAFAGPVTDGVPPRDITDPHSIASQTLPGATPAPIDDLFYTRGGLDAAWLPDGKSIVVSTNITGRYNLWLVPADGGFPQQLTQSDDRQSGLTASPDGKWIVFQSDHGGAEVYDLYAVPAAGGAVVDLTNTDDIDEQGPAFSPDGKLISFARRLKAEPSYNIAVMDFATRTVRELTHETAKDHAWFPAAFSHDGRTLLVNRTDFTGSESQAFTIDIVSGKATALTAAGTYNAATDISADGRRIELITQTDAGTKQAALLDLHDKSVHLLKPDAWEQGGGNFSRDGRTLIFSSNADGQTTLLSYDIASGTTAPLPLPGGVNGLASGDQSSFSPDGSRLLVEHQASNTPFDYWTVDVKTGSAAPLTRLSLASIDPSRLPKAQIVHYKSADGTVISALLWVPFNLARDGKAPGVVLPHGGPTGQTVDTFNRTAIALASRGFACIAPNVRGSTGYGKAFEDANRRDLGGGDLDDEVAGAQFMAATGYVNAKKIGITGGSYGGYMTLMAVAKTPTLWAAGVEQYGIIDWQAMMLREDATLQQYERGLIGDPVKDKDIYTKTSPLTYMENETAPLLVLQGDNDPRVPKDQAEKVIAVLKANHRTVDAHFYPGEGHGFAKREDQIDALQRTVAWLEKWLK